MIKEQGKFDISEASPHWNGQQGVGGFIASWAGVLYQET